MSLDVSKGSHSITGIRIPNSTSGVDAPSAVSNGQSPSNQPNDAYVQDGQLVFSATPVQTDRNVGLAKAKKLLQVVRLESKTKYTFGGRVKNEGINKQRSLRNYYPSLDVAREMANDPRMAEGVRAFIRQVSVPDDLRTLLKETVTIPSRSLPNISNAESTKRDITKRDFTNLEPEPAKPLITKGQLEEVDWKLHNFKPPNRYDYATDLNDERVEIAVRADDLNLSEALENIARDGKPDRYALCAVRTYARYKELGRGGVETDLGNYREYLDDLPDTVTSARVILRFAKAWEIDPATLTLHGKKLGISKGKINNTTAITDKSTSGPEPAVPLGTTELTEEVRHQIYMRNRANWNSRDFTTPILLNTKGLADSDIIKLTELKTCADIDIIRDAEDPATGDQALNVLRILARGKELGVDIERFAPGKDITDRLPPNEESARVLLRYAKAFNLNADKIILASSPITQWIPTHENLKSLKVQKIGAEAPAQLGLVGAPLFTTKEEFDSPELRDELIPQYALKNKLLSILESSPGHAFRACRKFARAGELGSEPRHKGRLNSSQLHKIQENMKGFENAIDVMPSHPQSVSILLRLTKAWSINPDELIFHGLPLSDWTEMCLETPSQDLTADSTKHPANPFSSANSEVIAEGRPPSREDFERNIDPLDPKKPGSPEKTRLDAHLAIMQDWDLSNHLSIYFKARSEGRFQVAPTTDLSESEKVAYAFKLLSRKQHLAVGPLLLGLFTDLTAKPIEAALLKLGAKRDDATVWSKFAEDLSKLPPDEAKIVLSELIEYGDSTNYNTLISRMLATGPVTENDLQTALTLPDADHRSAVMEAFAQRASIEPEGSKTRERILNTLKEKVATGEFSQEELDELVAPDLRQDIISSAQRDLESAIAAFAETDGNRAAINKLSEEIIDAGQLSNTATIAHEALNRLYQKDLVTRIPLKQADEELGGVTGAELAVHPAIPSAAEVISIGGIELPLNDRADKDIKAVPKAQNADLVMTPTTERNLRLMSAAWRTRRPVLLEGPTSSGKTSAVRFIAHKTQSPYRRINLSYFTDVTDLLGKYVGGEQRFQQASLDQMDDSEFARVASEYGIELTENIDRNQATKEILEAQHQPRWVDGPVIRAMKNGEVLLLDEINLARPEILERLNSLFDDDGNLVLTEHQNEVIAADKNFRLFGTMNPSSYSGRARLSDAMRSRWNNVYAHGLQRSDLTTIVRTRYEGLIPTDELAKLVSCHDALSRLADEGEIATSSGGVAFTLRNLFRAADRFVRYSGGALDDAAVMRREVEELYCGGLFEEEDIQAVKDILHTVMPYDGPNFYSDIEIKETKDQFEIGDVVIRKLNESHPSIPSESSRLVMTARTKQILYRMAKALDMGENVAMVGERASGKTAIAKMFAMLRGQPYQRQLLSRSTDASQLIGGYDNLGWKDGLLLDAARPDGIPGIFLADEFNLANPALLERLNSVLDDERKLVLAEKEGEEVRLHPEFRFIAAMNPPKSEYGGRTKLSQAMKNRFTMIAVPDLESTREQKEILAIIGDKLNVSTGVTDKLVELHQWVKKSYENETIGKDVRESEQPVHSIRQLINATRMIAEFQEQMGLFEAYQLAVQSTYASSSNLSDNEKIINKSKELAL